MLCIKQAFLRDAAYYNIELARTRRFFSGRRRATLNIQVFGLKKCRETQKAERYFKERKIPFHFVDLREKGLSKGELEKVKATVGIDKLLNRDGKEYSRLSMQYIVHNREEMMLKYPLLLNTPIVRNGLQATVGYCPEIWQTWQ